jgi:hypothetical protein
LEDSSSSSSNEEEKLSCKSSKRSDKDKKSHKSEKVESSISDSPTGSPEKRPVMFKELDNSKYSSNRYNDSINVMTSQDILNEQITKERILES